MYKLILLQAYSLKRYIYIYIMKNLRSNSKYLVVKPKREIDKTFFRIYF